jgi:CubicO group peptidase (beta-lactamase class C family)
MRMLFVAPAVLLALAVGAVGPVQAQVATTSDERPALTREDRALVDAFMEAANGDAAARDRFLRARLASASVLPRDETARILGALAAGGGVRLVSVTPRPSGPRLVVSAPNGRTARLDLIASDEPGRLAGIVPVAVPAPYPGPKVDTVLPPGELAAAIDRRVRFSADRDDFSGTVLVTKGDQVIYSASFGRADKARAIPNTADTRFNIGSMDKQFTAVAIGQLVEQGRLRFDARLIDVLPDYPNRAAAEKITIRHLLSHRAGLGMLFDRPGWDWKRRYERVSDLLPLFATAAPAFEPGSRFAYSNEGFVVLGAVVERLSGRSWYEYAAAHIFAPAGMRQTEYLTDDPAAPDRAVGYQFRRTDPLSVGGRVPNWGTLARRGNSCGGSFSTAGDMIRFLGALRGGKLLRPETLAALVEHGGGGTDSYALGFERESVKLGRTIVGHDGGGPHSGVNADAKTVWETGYTYAVLGNYDAPFAQAVGRDIGRILAAQ